MHVHVCVCSTNDHTPSKCSVSLNPLLSDAHSLSLATSVKYFSSLNQALPTQLTARHSLYLHLNKKDVDESTMPAFQCVVWKKCGCLQSWVFAHSPGLGNLLGMTYNLSTKPQRLSWLRKALPQRPYVKAEEMDCERIKPRPASIYHWAYVATSIPQRGHGRLNGFWLRVWGQGSYPQLNWKCFVG